MIHLFLQPFHPYRNLLHPIIFLKMILSRHAREGKVEFKFELRYFSLIYSILFPRQGKKQELHGYSFAGVDGKCLKLQMNISIQTVIEMILNLLFHVSIYFLCYFHQYNNDLIQSFYLISSDLIQIIIKKKF